MNPTARRRTALVTGGTRGIGLGIAQHLAQAGFSVAVNGVRPESEAGDSLQLLRSHGGEVLYLRGDISNAQTREGIVASLRQHWGTLEVLVNNAGVAPADRRDLLETTESSYDRVLEINLKGPFFLTQAVARWMVERRQAGAEGFFCIITISSISSAVASINRAEYCIAKSGLSMLTQLFATRLGPLDIPVYEVRPGVIQTDMTAAVSSKYDRLIADGLCLQSRWGQPDDVGKAVLALAQGSFPYSTGQVLLVDGGLTVQRL